MQNRVWQAALAGLLHDVGKMEQRARADPWNPPSGIESEGQPVHAAWSLSFIETYVPQKYRAAALAGAYHHAPERSPSSDPSLSELVALADKLGAGERMDLPRQERDLPKQLVTIFDRVDLGKRAGPQTWHYLPLQPLTLHKESIFPGEALDAKLAASRYEGLCDLLRDSVRVDQPDPAVYIETVLEALRTTAWCVPSAYYHSVPDVSLYDHSRSTAALAACLSGLEKDRVKNLLKAVQNDFAGSASDPDRQLLQQPVVALIGGDFSGIQDFIYTVSAKRAAKTLRGRSFYLQLLTEAVLRFVLDQLELPYTNVIYSGGGHFYLIAPLPALDQLPSIQGEVTRRLLAHHGSSLYLALAGVQVPASGFQVGAFPGCWSEMHAALSAAKLRRYSELGEDLIPDVFAIPEFGGNPEASCAVCGEDKRPVHRMDVGEEEQAAICDLCDSFSTQIGTQLPEARYLVLGLGDPSPVGPGSAADVLKSFGVSFQFLDDWKECVDLPGAKRVIVWSLGDETARNRPVVQNLPTVHIKRYTVNRIPPLTFNELQEKTHGGFKRLGVLRMDMDNLGEIFTRGLSTDGGTENIATLARLSTLSFQLSLFFEGWIKQVCESKPYHDSLYAVYSGGDDVFLIGPWDLMPGLAQEIVGDMAAYTGRNPDLHLSGGMAFIHGKYPVYQAAQDAGDALDLAKRSPGKAAFTYLGEAWRWADFERIAERAESLIQLTGKEEGEGEKGPKAIIQVLRQLAADQASHPKINGKPVLGPWIWQGTYLLYRMIERQGKQASDAGKIQDILNDLTAANFTNLDEWGTAARWAQLYTRGTSEKETELSN